MYRAVPVVLAVVLIVSFGVAEGILSNRWVPPYQMEEAVKRLDDVPRHVGGWVAPKELDQKLEADAQAKGRIEGYVMRRYVNPATGKMFSVLLVCGRPGPISAHTPDVCYTGSGYRRVQQQVRESHKTLLDTDKAPEFWVADFVKTSQTTEYLRVLWAWTTGGNWVAPDQPRITFAPAPVLYKLYVVRPMVNLNEPKEEDPTPDFLYSFMAGVNQALFPPPEAP